MCIRDRPNLELKVVTININRDCNRKLMEQCRILGEYAQYVEKVRENAETMSLDSAVKEAVDECIQKGILADFLRVNRAEVIAMSIFESVSYTHLDVYKRQCPLLPSGCTVSTASTVS